LIIVDRKAADSAALATRTPNSLGRRRATILEMPTTALTEAAKAAWWRRNVVKMAPDMLAQLTGYSVSAIYQFEHGVTRRGKPHKPKAWLRYKVCCAGVDNMCRTFKTFTWGIK
jgi:hypothetical protein